MASNRLLTDEEIEDVSTTCLFFEDCLLEPTLGGTITVNVLKAQDTKTLKAVGEWLEGECPHNPGNPNARLMFMREAAKRIHCDECLHQLKQGKMPETPE